MRMSQNWTNEQENAININGGAILVSAAAGSGKTAVLVERIINKITNGANIERFLIVTFTRSAASEMRERISETLQNKLIENPQNNHLQKQCVLVHKANICTIDSFYFDLVKTHFYSLDISNDFRIADEIEYKILKQELCNEIIEELHGNENSSFAFLADNFGSSKTDLDLENTIYKIVNTIEALPFPNEWLNKVLNYYDSDAKNNIWLDEAFSFIQGVLTGYINSYNKLLIELSDIPEIEEKLSTVLLNDLQLLENAYSSINSKNWDSVFEIINKFSFTRFPSIKGFTDHPQKLKIAKIRDLLKIEISNLKEGILSMQKEDFEGDLNKLYPMIIVLFDLVKNFLDRLLEQKKKLNFLTFSDVAQFTVKLLVEKYDEIQDLITPTQLAQQIALQYDEILIDEYQDTNEVQDLIFGAISNNRKNVFTVGDVKQSIYRFRYACPQIFMSRKQKANKNSNEQFPKLINLSKNFRSRKEILNFVNFVFSATMSNSFGEMDYDKNEHLYLGAKYQNLDGYNTQVDILQYTINNDDDQEQEEKTRDENEANYIANLIKKMLNESFLVNDTSTNKQRNAKPSDFVILLRSLKNRGELYSNALENVSVSAFCEQTTNFFESYEIEIVLALIQAIDNPYIDIPLIATMRSPIFSFTPDELAEIRICEKNSYFYNALLKAIQNGNEKCKYFVNKLKEYRTLARDLPIYRLLMHIYTDTSLYSLVGGMERGFIRQENLNWLCRLAKDFEETSIKGLFGFVNYINFIIEQEGNISGAKPSPSGDSVYITSIHKAKGLEFPICIIAGCSVKFNFKDLYSPLLIHQKLGIGIKIRDKDKLTEYTTLPRETIKAVLTREMLSEELRILYVALTRAKEKLIIVASEKNLENKVTNHSLLMGNSNRIDTNMLMSCRSFSDWIIAILLKHKDGTALRELYQGKTQVIESDFSIDVNIIKGLVKNEKAKSEIIQEIENNDIKDLSEVLENRFNYKYERLYLSNIPSKLSVSELKGRRIDDEDTEKLIKLKADYIRPCFIEQKEVLASEIGTAIHRFFQYANFKSCDSIEQIKNQLNILVEKGAISLLEAKNIDLNSLFKYFNSDLYKRLMLSNNIIKEYRFTTEINVKEYDFTIKESEETILLQGVIDCFFEEQDGFVLIDYKTDKVAGKNFENTLIERYKTQIFYYSYAIEKIFGKKVKQKYLYSLSLGKKIEIK